MKKNRFPMMGMAFAMLILLVVGFMLRLTTHRTPEIILPDVDVMTESGETARDAQEGSLRRVSVAPDTVQRVIEQLKRPQRYFRTVTIERIWNGGSAESKASVYVMDGWTRVDVPEGAPDARHVITGNGRTWIWYGSESAVYSGTAVFSADEEQNIPTYENVLKLNVDSITAADYRSRDALNCIYVETAPDELGYLERYWVSVESGLLVAAEREKDGVTVYRMTGLAANVDVQPTDAFVLPDGENLLAAASEET